MNQNLARLFFRIGLLGIFFGSWATKPAAASSCNKNLSDVLGEFETQDLLASHSLALGHHPGSLSPMQIRKKISFILGRLLKPEIAEFFEARLSILLARPEITDFALNQHHRLAGFLETKAKQNLTWMSETLKREQRIGRWKAGAKDSRMASSFYADSEEFLNSPNPSLGSYQSLALRFVGLAREYLSDRVAPMPEPDYGQTSKYFPWWPTLQNVSNQTVGRSANFGLFYVSILPPGRSGYVDGQKYGGNEITFRYFVHDLFTHGAQIVRGHQNLWNSREFTKLYPPKGYAYMREHIAFLAGIDFFSAMSLALEDLLDIAEIAPARKKRILALWHLSLWEGLEFYPRGMHDPTHTQLASIRLGTLRERFMNPHDLGYELGGDLVTEEDFFEEVKFLIEFRKIFTQKILSDL